MKFALTIATSAFALASVSAPALAQHQNMPGMHMPEPAKKKAPGEKKAATHNPKKAPVASSSPSHAGACA